MQIYFFLLMVCFVTQAHAIRLTGSEQAIQCARYFIDDTLIEYVETPGGPVTSEQVEVHAESYHTFVQARQTVGEIRKEDLQEIVSTLHSFLASEQDRVAQLTWNSVQHASESSSSLLVCILKGECRLSGHRLSRYIFQTDGTFDFGSKGQRTQDGGDLRTLDGLGLASHAIVANLYPRDETDKDCWLALFAANLSRYATYELIKEWVKANQARSAEGADDLFQRYATVQGQDVFVDPGFAQILAASNASRLMLQFLRHRWQGGFGAYQHWALQEQAMRELLSQGERTKKLLRRLSVTKGNVMHIGTPWTEAMLKTLEPRLERN